MFLAVFKVGKVYFCFCLGYGCLEICMRRDENDFLWLQNAKVAIPAYNASEPKLPLLISKNSNLFKLFANDVGLLCYRLLDTGIQKAILAHEKNINFSGIFENAVAQELTCHGFGHNKLFYFANKKTRRNRFPYRI